MIAEFTGLLNSCLFLSSSSFVSHSPRILSSPVCCREPVVDENSPEILNAASGSNPVLIMSLRCRYGLGVEPTPQGATNMMRTELLEWLPLLEHEITHYAHAPTGRNSNIVEGSECIGGESAEDIKIQTGLLCQGPIEI